MRIRGVDREPRAGGRYVLYWMTAFRRPRWNFALERAVRWSEKLARPLVVLEALRLDYPWASERHHRFILEGMRDNAGAFAGKPVLYYPYVEPERSAGKGLVSALAASASVVVTDDFPAFMIPRMAAAAAERTDCRFELVDSNGLLPMRAAPRAFGRAVDFRRFLQKELGPWLDRLPAADPLAGARIPSPGALDPGIERRWPRASGDLPALAGSLPVDHAIAPGPMRGGCVSARARMEGFVEKRLSRYPDDRNVPDLDGTSGFSPYLHFGHLSVHEIFARIAKLEGWTPAKLAARANGSKEGWWGMSPAAEAFLDELVTWRELGFNLCSMRQDDYGSYESLPAWARATLEAHQDDPRPHLYSVEQLEAAATHDPLWNAAQRQMMRDGWFHNYMRMLWGKKILEWSRTPRDALAAMIHLMNKYSLDGRDPSSYTGYLWALGGYDRPWGPERPVFGAVRYMSSENTARKLSVKGYLQRYAA